MSSNADSEKRSAVRLLIIRVSPLIFRRLINISLGLSLLVVGTTNTKDRLLDVYEIDEAIDNIILTCACHSIYRVVTVLDHQSNSKAQA